MYLVSVTPVLVLLLWGASPVSACPSDCQCGPDNNFPTFAVCSGKDSIRIIPQDLPPALTKLDLSSNAIRSVESTISHYQALTHLHLSRNKISVIEPRCFQELHDLAFLDLSDNELGSFDYGAFVGLFKLHEIDLSGNNLETLPPGLFAQSPNVESVYLAGNRLATLSVHVFDGVTSLLTLNLAKNSFTSVPAGSYEHLESLKLDENEIGTVFASDFDQYPKLRKLSLNGCGIEKLPPGTFSGMPFLQKLALHSNGLETFPTDAVSTLSHLNDLNLGLNYFTGIGSESLRGLKNLERLVILGCAFDVPFAIARDAFKHSMNLKELNISKCHGLTHLESDTLSPLPYLEVVNLHDNNLVTIPENFADWSTLRYFDVSGNPLNCDCSVAWLSVYLRDNIERGYPATHCETPLEYSGTNLVALSNEALGCPPGAGTNVGGQGSEEESSDGSSIGLILGIVLCSVVIFILLGFGIYKLWYKKKYGDRSMSVRMRRMKKRNKLLRKSIGSVTKAQIEVIPTEVGDVPGYFDVVSPIEDLHDDDLEANENIYEEMPTSQIQERGPDVKTSIL